MAPPRQRTTAVQDDSRSEASSGARELKGAAAKGRKVAHGPMTVNSIASREIRISASVATVTSAPVSQGEPQDDLPKISWSEMPLEFLHSYRHAYKLSSPSAFSRDYSRILLSRGIGLQSPTSIASKRAQLSLQNHEANGSHGTSTAKPLNGKARTNGVSRQPPSGHKSSHRRKDQSATDGKNALHNINGQDRVSKNQLALAVRKHFNSAGLAEQEAIARFLYKVREEGRGRQFRLKFQP